MSTPAATGPKEPELAAVGAGVHAFRADVEAFLSSIGDEGLGWRPDPNRWTIAECMVHLVVTFEGYRPVMESAIAEARARGVTGQGPFRHGRVLEWLIPQLEPPPKRRVRAPRRFAIEQRSYSRGEAVHIVTVQDDFLGLLALADGLDIGRVKITSPASRLLRMTLGQAFRLLDAHQRRHLWQARRIGDEPGFPR